MTFSTILIFFVILLVLVIVHEAGHFFAAKISKMRVDEFAFGFPPKIFGFKKNGTEYNFNLLPLGGYVKIHGENGSGENIDDADKTFGSRPKWQQIFVLSAGVLMNIVLAWVLLSATFALGTTIAETSFTDARYITNKKTLVANVVPNSPSEKAGIKQLDEIVSISAGSEKITNPSDSQVPEFVSKYNNEPITLVLKNNEGEKSVSVSAENFSQSEKKIIGISSGTIGTYKAPVHVAAISGALATYEFTKLTFVGFYDLIKSLFSGRGSEAAAGLTGPIGIVSLVGSAQKEGLPSLLSFAALISINLAVLNILPFPALDGGRIVFVLIEAIRRKPLSINFQTAVNGISFLALIALMIFVTYKDIIKFI